MPILGGIDLLNAAYALDAGADSVAVISGILPEPCDRKTVRRRAEEWIRVVASPTRANV